MTLRKVSPAQPKWKLYLKKLGIVGFLFFFIKGLIWLAVIYFGVEFFTK